MLDRLHGRWFKSRMAGNLGTHDETVNVMGTFVGVNRLHIEHVSDHGVVVDNPIGAQDFTRELGRFPGYPDVVAFGQRDLIVLELALVSEPGHLEGDRGRYRLAIVPVLLVGAGFAITVLVETVRERNWRTLALAAAGLAVVAVVVNVRIVEMGFAHMHNTVGALLGERGDTEAAATEFRKALEDNPRDLSARYNLGTALLKLHRWEDAAVQFMVATEGHPRYHEAWIGLGKARAGQGRTVEARALWKRALALNPPPMIAAEADSLLGALEHARPDADEHRDRTGEAGNRMEQE